MRVALYSRRGQSGSLGLDRWPRTSGEQLPRRIIEKYDLSLTTSGVALVYQEITVASALPNQRVFVIQLTADADPGHGLLVGRVEHVPSGLRVRFASGEEMNEFFALVLGEEDEFEDEARGGPLQEDMRAKGHND
jgi:hypothetical protein